MLGKGNYPIGFRIDQIASCDFTKLNSLSNQEILEHAHAGKKQDKLIQFIAEKMGIEHRYHAPSDTDALDLARSALVRLIEKDPSLVAEAEFIIYAGISSPMPTVCLAAFLASEMELRKVSCWDLKSGCSTGVLALLQALDWFQHGCKRGIIVCSETFSKFANPETLQMAASIGDGAVALSISASLDWKVLGCVHGTDASYMKSMYVPGKYPVNLDSYAVEDYFFAFDQKGDTLEKLAHYWGQSLADLFTISKIKGNNVNHYVAHQVDGTKNRLFALAQGIQESSIALNFAHFGNMGCPTIFVNYEKWVSRPEHNFKKDDHLVFHAVGGGLSWAGICLKKVN